MLDLSSVSWRKSTHSDPDNACVEVAEVPVGMAVRDSKDPSGPALIFITVEWNAFVSGVKAGDFERR
ncbi:DUF397 domain-containing protein [Catellatospora methionotrophica]|uniref:DUF397 domain-containing protein n=1 Tax=Catellatospora methionotrophica TaxID=121620 RepID=UPI0033C250FE